MVIVLLTFSRSLATKWMSLNNEPCMAKTNLIDLYPVNLIIIHSWLV